MTESVIEALRGEETDVKECHSEEGEARRGWRDPYSPRPGEKEETDCHDQSADWSRNDSGEVVRVPGPPRASAPTEENSDALVGDGLPDVPLYGVAGGKTRAVEDAGPYDAGTGAARNGPPRASAPTEGTDAVRGPDPAILTHLRSLQEQAEELKREFPDFDLDAALHDPAFLRLTAPALGVGVREAFYALNRPRLDELAAARAAEASKALLARAVSGGAQRPREGGGSGAAALLRNDYAALSRPRQLALKQRIREAAARGEKMYP